MNTQKNYKFYAFVSYSRKNSPAANYLQKSLERSKIPTKKIHESLLPDDGKHIKPVFLDKRDLEVSEKDFSENIQYAIENSRYLLVLCSPESAQSEWVGREISYFLETHDNDLNAIVPIILSGHPGSGGEDECLPEALRREEIVSRNLPNMTAEKDESEKQGWENGLVQAMSYMLRVDRESIKATIDAEKMRIQRNYTLISLTALLISSILTAWALFAERKAKNNADLAQRNEFKANLNAKTAKNNEARAVAGEKKALENEVKANEQTEVAKKTLEFLQNVFNSSDPAKSGNKDVKLIDVINAKIPEIHKIKEWQIKASVAMIVGDILCNSGKRKEALELMKISVSLYEKHAPGTKESALSYDNIGSVYYYLGDYTAALENCWKALTIYKRSFPDDYENISKCYNNIGAAYIELKNYPAALENIQKALSFEKKIVPSNHLSMAHCYNNLGTIYANQGNYPAALENFQKSLSIRRQVLPSAHPDIAQSYNNLGSMYDTLKNYPAALENYHKALSICKQVLPSNHPYISHCYNNLGSVYANQGNYSAALENFQKSLLIRRQVLPSAHPDIAQSYNNLGFVYYQMGNYAAALKNYHNSLLVVKQQQPINNLDVAHGYGNIGMVYLKMGKYKESCDYIRKAYEIMRSIHGNMHSETKQYFKNLQDAEQKLKESQK